MPPLLKTLSERSIYSVKKLVLLSKSERIFGLGAGLLMDFNFINVHAILC